jgi:hypothetical protein
MEVEYSLTLADFKAWATFHRRNKPKARRPAPGLHRTTQPKSHAKLWWWLFLVLVAAATFLTLDSPSGALFHDVIGYGLAGVVGAIVGAIAILVLLAWAKVVNVRMQEELVEDARNRWLVGPRRLRITPEGVQASSEHHRAFVGWPIVWFIGATDEHIFLYIATNQAYIVPRHAFANLGEFEAFLAQAARYRDDYPPAAPERPTGITTIPTVLPVHDIQGEPSP